MRDQRASISRAVLPLPELCLTQLIDAGELDRHEVVTRKDDAHAAFARGRQELQDVSQHPVAVGDLAQDPGLHVVHDERKRRGIQRIGK